MTEVRRLAYCAQGSHFVLLERAVEVGTRTGPDLIEYTVYLCDDCAQDDASEALLASWRADLADGFLNSTHTHSMRTTRLFWEYLETLWGKRTDDSTIDLLYDNAEQPTIKLATVEGETHG